MNSHPHYLGHRQRLRERFIKNGLAGFANSEVVELLLCLAIPRADVKPTAEALIARFGNLKGIMDAPLDDLQAINGIGAVSPVALRVICEAANLYLQQSAEQRDSRSFIPLLAMSEKPRLFRPICSLTQEGFGCIERCRLEGLDTFESLLQAVGSITSRTEPRGHGIALII